MQTNPGQNAAVRATPDVLNPLDREDLMGVRRVPAAAWACICSLSGLGLLAATWIWTEDVPWRSLQAEPAMLAVAALLVLLGELFSIDVARRDETTTLASLSTTIAVAMVAVGPISFLLAVQVAAVVIDDLQNRRAPFKIVFNAGQYITALLLARAVYCLVSGTGFLAGPQRLTVADVPATLAAGLVFLLVNESLVSIASSLLTRDPPLRGVPADLRMTTPITLVLVGMAPLAGYLLTNALPLLPLMLLPGLAVWYLSWVAAQRQRISLQDPQTGLPNRTLLYQRMDKAVADQDRGAGPPVALLLLDVDHFKDVNDVLGHQTGDLLLRELGQRIAGVVRPGEVVARLGGDEFALLLRGRDVATRAHTLARQLLADLIEPLDLPGVRLAVQCSVGVAVVEAPGVSVNELVKRADIALYEAKRERASVGVYSQQACTAAARRLSLLPDLRDAIAAGELRVQYQPLIEGGTGKLLGAEALCRWRHPVRGPVSPADFIPLAENSGLIGGLTRLVLNQALQTTRQWLDCGLDLQVSVNISPRLVSDGALPELVAELLGRHQVPADRLTLEVTESSVVNDANRATVVLDQLRQVGVRLSMDDFGTGYSSLSVLQAVDVDELKLDRSFVSTVDRVSADAILVRSTIKLAHALGLTVVAEGVENEAVAGELRVMRCDHLQGNLFGRPMSAEAITALAGDRGLTRYRNQVVDLKAAERRREGYRQVL